ncbi:MAG: M20/M25/M40 family metallo-hydrolase [Legionellales bacterium]
MMSVKYGFLLVVLCNCWSNNSMSQSPSVKERLIVSNSMAYQLNAKAHLLGQSDKFSLIETVMDDVVMQTLHSNKPNCGGFLNLDAYDHSHSYKKLDSQHLLSTLTQTKSAPVRLFSIKHKAQVKQLYQLIDPNKIWQTSQHLTSYINRSAKTVRGVIAAHWFKQQFDTLAHEYGRSDVSSYFVNTGAKYKQPSVVTLIGKGKSKDAVVIGAHIDTLGGNMPGADDDASGIAVVLEIARVLLAADFEFESPVYIVAYAAEENGLVGSAYVVQSFLNKKIPVTAVMQLDQAGFRANPKDQTIWLTDDYVDTELTDFTAKLLTAYVKVPVAYTHCGYACSDHANWSIAGFRTCYPSATTLDDDNPYIHTAEDKLDTINLEHMTHFTQLGLAFAAELGLKGLK